MSASRQFHRVSVLLALVAASCSSKGDAPAAREKSCSFPEGAVAIDAACGCTRVEGDLSIDAGRSGDLRCLDSLREVTGKLSIASRMSSPSLTRLRGLRSLRRVKALVVSDLPVVDLGVFAKLESAQELVLKGLPRIRDLRGLERVAFGQLTLQNLAELQDLSGLRVPEKLGALTLRELPKLASLSPLRGVREAQSILLDRLAALTTLEGLEGTIDRFELKECGNLEDLRGLRADIRQLRLEGNARLGSLAGFVGLLARPGAVTGPDASIEAHPELASLEGLFRADQQAIQRLHLLGLPKLELVDLRSASAIKVLVVRTCNALREIRGVAAVEAIEQLHLTALPALPRLPDFAKLQRVGDLEVIELTRLTDLASLSSLASGEAMAFNMLDSLVSLHGLERLASAGRLLLEDLPALEALDGLRGLRSADTLWFSDNDKLESLRGLKLTRASELAVRYNDKLQTLDGLETLAEVGTLDFSENPKLVSVRALRGLQKAEKVFARANIQLAQCELDQLAKRLPAGSTHEFHDNGPAGACPP